MLLRKIVSLAAGVLVLGGCSDDPVASSTVENNLVFTRQDGSRVEFTDQFYVWCGRWEPDVATPSLHVSTRTMVGGRAWRLQAVRADVGPGATLTFPISFNFDEPRGVRLFVLDGENELNTDASDSSGTITFQEASCERGGTVRFTMDAVLGSEFGDGGAMRVTGAFTGEVGPTPR